MNHAYQKDGQWYCAGICAVADVGPFSSSAEAELCWAAMNAVAIQLMLDTASALKEKP